MSPTLKYAFFCDDVRQETSGKFTAVGLWADRLRVDKPEAALLRSMAFHALVGGLDRKFRIKFAVTGPLDGVTLARFPIDGDLPISAGKNGANIAFVVGPVTIIGPGTVRADLWLTDEDGFETTFSSTVEIVGPEPSLD